MKSLIINILLLFMPFFCMAQHGIVSGKVQDNATKEALSYVTISIQDTASKNIAVGVTDDKRFF